MSRRPEDVALIAPDGHDEAQKVGDWLDAQGVAYTRVTSVVGSPLVLRVGDATVAGPVDEVIRRLQDLLWRDLQS